MFVISKDAFFKEYKIYKIQMHSFQEEFNISILSSRETLQVIFLFFQPVAFLSDEFLQ